MNCKPGDLAIVVANEFIENIGRLCEVLRPVDAEWAAQFVDGDDSDWVVQPVGEMWGWKGDGPNSVAVLDGARCSMRDVELRPIRNGDGEDEMLALVGKPEGVTA